MEMGSPLARLEETIGLLRQWWSPEAVASIYGEFQIEAWRRVITPATRPPIYLAAAGPKALDLAGRVADGVLFSMLATPLYLEKAIARVRASATSAGRNPKDLHFIGNPGILVTDDPAPILAGRKRFLANVLTLPGMETVLENPALDVPGIMQRVRTHMKSEELLARGGAFADFAEHGDLAAAVAEIPDGMVESGSLVGPISTVREGIQAFAELGLTELEVSRMALSGTAEEIRATLDSFRA
jgi:5,10-methylenetetrahydromethanopterin reductase